MLFKKKTPKPLIRIEKDGVVVNNRVVEFLYPNEYDDLMKTILASKERGILGKKDRTEIEKIIELTEGRRSRKEKLDQDLVQAELKAGQELAMKSMQEFRDSIGVHEEELLEYIDRQIEKQNKEIEEIMKKQKTLKWFMIIGVGIPVASLILYMVAVFVPVLMPLADRLTDIIPLWTMFFMIAMREWQGGSYRKSLGWKAEVIWWGAFLFQMYFAATSIIDMIGGK